MLEPYHAFDPSDNHLSGGPLDPHETERGDATNLLASRAPLTSLPPRRPAFNVPPAVPSPPPLSSRYKPPSVSLKQDIRQDPSDVVEMEAGDRDKQDQWLFSELEIANTPSVNDGIPGIEERLRRAKGVNFIIQAGIILKLPQLTLATAAVFFHRFYMRYSMAPEKGGLHYYNIAATSLFLATKTEENCRKTKEIVIAVAKVAQKNASLIIDEQSKEFWRWKDSILIYEELMLELLTFDVVLESPYMHLYESLKLLEVETNRPLRNAAWAFLNDSCMTMLCLIMPPKQISASALYFAARYVGEKIPDDDEGLAWWIRIGGDGDSISKAVDLMYQFYHENPLKKTENPHEKSPGSRDSVDLESTRLRLGAGGDSPTPGERAEALEREAEREEIEKERREGQDGQSQHRISRTPIHSGERDGEATYALDEAGDSDARLKEAANDLASHQNSSFTQNGTDISGVSFDKGRATDNSSSAKRDGSYTGNAGGLETHTPKRRKVESDDESEEGEVEE